MSKHQDEIDELNLQIQIKRLLKDIEELEEDIRGIFAALSGEDI